MGLHRIIKYEKLIKWYLILKIFIKKLWLLNFTFDFLKTNVLSFILVIHLLIDLWLFQRSCKNIENNTLLVVNEDLKVFAALALFTSVNTFTAVNSCRMSRRSDIFLFDFLTIRCINSRNYIRSGQEPLNSKVLQVPKENITILKRINHIRQTFDHIQLCYSLALFLVLDLQNHAYLFWATQFRWVVKILLYII